MYMYANSNCILFKICYISAALSPSLVNVCWLVQIKVIQND